MTRQQALEVIWRRLLIVFVGVIALSVVIVLFAGNLRTSFLIFITGNIGGYVAVHKSLAELKDVELAELSRSWLGIIVPSIVGGLLAYVLYLLFLSGILAGELFPDFEPHPDAPRGFESLLFQYGKSMEDYGKLFFWSFIAGFNQKYVVDIINSVRSKP
jgi:hypothetical protein